MSCVIREASPADASDLLHLIRDHAAFERSAASLTKVELLMLLSPYHQVRFLVATQNEALLGYAAVLFEWSVWRARRYAHLDCLFVSQSHRGRGIGKRLFEDAKAIASSEGLDLMEWQTPVWNEDAIRFYVREGAICQKKVRFSMQI